METIKWAINATGNIAHRFAEGMQCAEGSEITAIYSTGLDRAKAFAEEFGLDGCECYDDFEAMLSQGGFDAVYICTPNHMHYENSMQCLKHGVNVLCEKPMADTLEQTRELLAAAEEADVFLLEGMWTRFFPAVKKVRAWLKEGKIGRTKTVFASFGTDQRGLPSQWRYSSKASGGALRDVGIYPIAFSYLVFGKQDDWTSNCMLNEAGIDIYNNLMLRYDNDKAAFITSSLVSTSPYDVRIVGTEGQIIVYPDFWRPAKAELFKADGSVLGLDSVEVFEEEYLGSGFEFEIMAFADCLRENKKDAEEYTHTEMLQIAELMEEIRKSWGITYESDE